MGRKFLDVSAKIIRCVAIPPTFVAILSVLMYLFKPEAFRNVWDLTVLIIALAVLPALAYPLAAIIPYFREKGRSGSRTLAFIGSTVGYIGGAVYSAVSGATGDLKFIFFGYLIALYALTMLNKVFKVKASGHACGILGPMLYMVYFFGLIWLIPFTVIAALVVWSSIYRKSHTAKELLLGAACACLGFFALLPTVLF